MSALASPTVSSSPATSSAVVIPTPGKSILKKPPPPPPPLFSFSRITKLLPAAPPPPPSRGSSGGGAEDDRKALKRAHFILPQLATVYPISTSNPPHMPTTQDEKRNVESREGERRRRVIRGNSFSQGAPPPGYVEDDDHWSMEKVDSFYRECCESRDEFPHPRISAALKAAAGTNPRTVDLSGVQISLSSAAILSDVFSIEWGLRKLIFKESDLDEHNLKPILHALLIPESLHFLSVSLNRRLKTPAYRLIGAWLAQAKSLKFLDLSQNPLDKRAIEYIASALPTAPQPGLESLKLDDCALKPNALEALAHVVRTSSLRNISLRHNKISATGTVALALMIKDYPDSIPVSSAISSSTSSASSSLTGSPASSVVSLPTSPTSPTTPGSSFAGSSLSARLAAAVSSPPLPPAAAPKTQTSLPPPPQRAGPILPPPQHPNALPHTTYTPYVPRAKRIAAARSEGNPLAPNGHPVPTFTSSASGGVTTRHAVGSPALPVSRQSSTTSTPVDHGPSAALLDKVRQLDALPRLGALQTLDLKGNEIRNGVSYIAQVLKRNRTLKVLNLSENKLDVQGLVQIADALKYNACLETLDLSRNPCCGPSLDGIQSLRTAFTLNTALKQLFLASTGLTSAGAIALAEFLPESSSLLVLGLTDNVIDLAGVMALSGGLKGNHVMRCLDLSIPPGDEDMARVCRDIFNTCVRNTEEAEKANREAASAEGEESPTDGKAVWGMIEKSQLAKSIRLDDAKKSATELPGQVRQCMTEMEAVLTKAYRTSLSPPKPVSELDATLGARAADLATALEKLIQKTNDPGRLEELLVLNDALNDLAAGRYTPPAKPKTGLGLNLGILPHGTVNGGSILSPNGVIHEDPELLTPRGSRKGKERAEPEPEPFEKVTTPTFVLESDNEDDENAHGLPYGLPPPSEGEASEDDGEQLSPSQTERSKIWVEEEGEVFRKGQKLLGPEEMEGDYDSEELRQELLEAEVDRPPPRPINVDEFGMDIGVDPNSPVLPPPGTPTTPTSATAEPSKEGPRPYVPRRRTSQASMNSTSSGGSARSNDTVKS